MQTFDAQTFESLPFAGFEEVEHTADGAYRVWAQDLEALFIQSTIARYGIHLSDRELVCAPIDLEDGQSLGQPVLVPGSMGTERWILGGTTESDCLSFGSSCHGAGRVMSRARAKREIRGERLRSELEQEGIRVRAGSMQGLAEEAPQAYQDVSHVVDVVSQAGIACKVARLHPIAVVKG
jgi:RNA-splicing ligase RtcB